MCPAPFSKEVISQIQDCAVRAHRAVGARDMSRVDFFVDESQSPAGVTMLEINTLPGMTATSLYPEAAAVYGVDFAELCDRLVKAAYARGRRSTPEVLMIPT